MLIETVIIIIQNLKISVIHTNITIFKDCKLSGVLKLEAILIQPNAHEMVRKWFYYRRISCSKQFDLERF